MRILSIILLMLFYAVTSTAQPSGALPLSNEHGAVKGKVVDTDSKEPIPFAKVALFRSGTMFYSTSTNFEGDFKIDSVVVGQYKLGITFIGYLNQSIPVNILADDPTFLDEINLTPVVEELVVEIINDDIGPFVTMARQLSMDRPFPGSTIQVSLKLTIGSARPKKVFANELIPEGFNVEIVDGAGSNFTVKDNALSFKFRKIGRDIDVLDIKYNLTVPADARGEYSITGNAGTRNTITASKSSFVVRQGVKLIPGK